MADIIKDLTNYRIKGIEKAEIEYYKQLTQTLDRIEAQIVSLADRELPRQAGKLIELQSAVAIRPKIKAILDKEYLPFADRVVRKGFGEQAKRVERQFKTIGLIPPEFQELTKGDLALVQNLKKQYYTQFKDVSNNFTRVLSDKVYQNTLVGTEFTVLEKELRESINGIYATSSDPAVNRLVDYVKNNRDNPALASRYASTRVGENMKRYAGQILNDSLRDFDATLNFSKAKDAGLTYVKYYGDVIPTTRDICRRMVSGSLNRRPNGLFTLDEINEIWASRSSRSWSGKKGGNPMIVRGGYNCRHQFSYVNPDWYEEDGDETVDLIESKQDTKPAKSIFGDTSLEEKKYLPLAFGTVATNFTRMIDKVPKLPPIKKVKKGAYFQPRTGEIAMSNLDMEDLATIRTFTHEYGHKIDHNIAELLSKDRKLAEKFIPNANKTIRTTKLIDDVLDTSRNPKGLQISNIAQQEIMADRKLITDNLKKSLPAYINDNFELLKRRSKSKFTEKVVVQTKFVEDIIKSKQFPLELDEVKALLSEKNIIYDPMENETLEFVLGIKHKVLFSQYGKYKKYTLANGSTSELSVRQFYGQTRSFQGKFADYVGAISDNTIGYGHTKAYYKKAFRTQTKARGYGDVTYLHSTEAFAQYTALSNTKNKEAYIKLMNYFAPNTTKIFDEIMERSKLL
jgi:hypothetical protein